MLKKYKVLLIVMPVIIVTAITFILLNINMNAETNYSGLSQEATQMQLESLLYTQPDDYTVNTNKGSLNSKDQLVNTSNNGKLSLYFDSELCIFKVKNNETGYIWASAMDDIPDDTANMLYGGFLSSSISIDYYQLSGDTYDPNIRKAWITQAIKSTNYKGEIPAGMEGKFQIAIAPNTEYEYAYLGDTVKISVTFASAAQKRTDKTVSLGISMNVYVNLDDDGLHVRIPSEEIKEEDKNYLLAGISVMPLMGATYNNETPGYMMIPDGSGALIRYGSVDSTLASQYAFTYYGSNIGSQYSVSIYSDRYESKELTMPVFGFVNGVNQDACLGILEDGSTLANLTISPVGSFNMKVNSMYPTFRLRYTYYLYGVNLSMIENFQSDNISISYRYLSNDSANYVGLANSYQDYLLENNQLVKQASDTYKLRIDYLISDSVKSMFGYTNQEVTSVKAINSFMSVLDDNNINYISVLKGWNKKGSSGATPYQLKYFTKAGSKKSFKDLIQEAQEKGNTIYLYNDYVLSYDRGISNNSDIAYNNLMLKMKYNDAAKVLFNDYAYLSPDASLKYANKNINKYQKLGASNIALGTIGNKLFSYNLKKTNYTREDALEVYDKLLSTLDSKYGLALYQPNSYFYKYTKDYLDAKVYSNTYQMYSDNVPFVSYVLKGYIDLYGDYLNFNAIGSDMYLRYLDYAVYPSYILTEKISYNLKYTDSYHYYTTAISDFKDEILSSYNTYKEGYEAILNSKVVKRITPDNGISIIVYQNLDTLEYTTLMINYQVNDYIYDTYTIPSKSYIVVGGLYA